MKKMMMMAAVAVAAMTFTSCNNGGKANLKTDVDTLSYNLGVAQSDGLKQYMTMQLGVDSAYIDQFIKGMKEGALNESDPRKEAYMKGLEIGKQVKGMAEGLGQDVFAGDSTQTINVNNLLAGLIAGLKGTAEATPEEAYAAFNEKLTPIREANIEKRYAENKAAGEKFLAENKAKEGVKVTPSGVQYKVIVEGDGEIPSDTSRVKVNYEGKLIDGTVFDSSYERDMPFEVNMAAPRVIPGWVEILKLMPAGSKWEVVIPQEQAYGKQNMGQIKPFSTLIFTIELLK